MDSKYFKLKAKTFFIIVQIIFLTSIYAYEGNKVNTELKPSPSETSVSFSFSQLKDIFWSYFGSSDTTAETSAGENVMADCFIQAIEMENFTTNIAAANGDAWVQVADPLAQNGQAMQTLPNDGTNFGAVPGCCDGIGTDDGALITFDVNLPFADNYYLFVSARNGAGGGTDDSFHTGVNGTYLQTYNNLNDGYEIRTINLGALAAGTNTVNIWQREDGALLDNMIISTFSALPDTLVKVFAIQPSCTNGVPQSDGHLQFSRAGDADRFNYSVGSTYTGPTDYDDPSVITISSTPIQFNTGLSNADAGDFTIRAFFGGSGCFTDIVVTLNTQDCSASCNCTDYLYVNDVDLDAVHKFRLDPNTGALTEIGSPWLDNIQNPHGAFYDLNGRLYIGEALNNLGTNIQQVSCDGTRLDTLNYNGELHTEAEFNNFVSRDNIMYINGEEPHKVNAFDLCSETYLGSIDFDTYVGAPDGRTWELMEGYDKNMYATSRTDDTLKIYQIPFDTSLYNDPITHIVYPTITTNLVLTGEHFGLEQDENGNWWTVHTDNNLYKISPVGVVLDTFPDPVGIAGWSAPRGLEYNADLGILYIASDNNDCAAAFNINTEAYVPAASYPGGGGKDLSLGTECCPSSNNITIDTVFCGAVIGQEIILSELITCTGIICEASWSEVAGNNGFTYDPCRNTTTVTLLDACGTYVLESDGSSELAECGAFIITVNIAVDTVMSGVIAGDQSICAGEDPDAFTVTTPATGGGTLSYQWQSSTVDCTTGFTDIAGATSATYDSPNNIIMDTYFRVITTSANASCATGTCADTSNCLTISTVQCDWGDLPDTSSMTTIQDYQTNGENDGPVHVITPGLSIGMTVDVEDGGQASMDGLADGSDEDGFSFPSTLDINPGGTLTLPIDVINTTGTTAHLEIWIDWNGDGDFDDPGEMIANLSDDGAGDFGQTSISIPVPSDVETDTQIGFRARLSHTDDMTPNGRVDSGEVEDYLIQASCQPEICLPITITRN